MFKELDTVELTHDIKRHGLKEGDFGAIVLVYNDQKAYEVEFVKPNGRTKALLTLTPSDIRPFTTKPTIGFDAPLVVNNAYAWIIETKSTSSYKLGTRAKRSKEKTEEYDCQFAQI